MSTNNSEYNEFITKLGELTKSDKITWEYLDSNKSLYNSINLSPYNTYDVISAALEGKKSFDTSNSYFTKINDNFIILYTDSASKEGSSLVERLRLLLVPRTFKSIRRISNSNESITLLTIIKSKFPSADDIIQDINALEN